MFIFFLIKFSKRQNKITYKYKFQPFRRQKSLLLFWFNLILILCRAIAHLGPWQSDKSVHGDPEPVELSKK
jgi:hypothetical protein